MFGELNPGWRYDEIGYAALHGRIERRYPKPNECEKETNKLDLSNIYWQYLNDISDWEWLCRSCHNKKDWRNGNQAAKIFEVRKDGTYGKRIT